MRFWNRKNNQVKDSSLSKEKQRLYRCRERFEEKNKHSKFDLYKDLFFCPCCGSSDSEFVEFKARAKVRVVYICSKCRLAITKYGFEDESFKTLPYYLLRHNIIELGEKFSCRGGSTHPALGPGPSDSRFWKKK